MSLHFHEDCSPRRLIPKIIDQTAVVYPTKLYSIFPKTNSIAGGLVYYTYKELADAINHVARYLDENLTESVDFDTFAYIGSKDIRYSILAVAALKTGRKVLFPSPFSSVNGLLHLLEATKCPTVLVSESFSSNTLVKEACEKRSDLKAIVVPARDSWLFPEQASDYPYEKSFEQAENDPFMIVHTSGTTGAPKPIVYTNSYVSTYDAQRFLDEQDGLLWWHIVAGKKMFSPMPTLHVAGIFASLILPVFFDTVIVLGPGDQPLSLALVNEIHGLGILDGGLYPPSILEEISKSPAALQSLQRLDFVIFTGAPLVTHAAKLISSSTKIHSMIGSTELGVYPTMQCPNADWMYFHFHPMFGHVMESRGEGRFELVLHRSSKLRSVQSVFHIYPDSNEYRTRDLFIQHPTKPNYWKYQGRVDDLIILSHGEDLDPIAMEEVIRQNPIVNAAVIGGEGRSKPFLLCELKSGICTGNDSTVVRALDALKPSLTEANELCSQYVGLDTQLVLFTASDKPLVRTLKGGINRQLSIESYRSEIDGIYDTVKK